MSQTLESAIENALARAKATGRPRLVAWVEPLADSEVEPAFAGTSAKASPSLGASESERTWADSLESARDAFVWERSEAGRRFAAIGALEELESEGADRFAAIRDGHADLVARLEWHGAARPGERPLLVGGFGFEPKASTDPDWKSFPAARFVLPEAIVESFAPGQGCRVAFARVEPGGSSSDVLDTIRRRLDRARARDGSRAAVMGSTQAPVFEARAGGDAGDEDGGGPEYRVRADRSHARFRAQIARALEAIATGRLSKLVLARSLSVLHDADFDVPGFLDRLRALYPSCTLVAVARGRDAFLAATPETLVRVAAGRVETAALAGSAPRGRTPAEDEALGSALLASPKERAEHAHVVEAIRAVLGARCDALRVSEAPQLRALFGIQHLETEFEGRLRSPASDILALVEALHPTPAVAGAPAREALDWLRRNEGLERGWYAAPIGWLDAEGGGDFCVGLRSALIRNGVGEAGQGGASRARLFAGAGVVAGSRPEQELVETRIKLRALLAPLTEI